MADAAQPLVAEPERLIGSSEPLLGQGKQAEALAILAEIYNWFTEGFDTADLKEAKALLEELNA